MIHRIEDYNATLTSPDTGRVGQEVWHRPVVERVIVTNQDIEDIRHSLVLILKAGYHPVAVIFEPIKEGRFK
jgi:hypothetical protein